MGRPLPSFWKNCISLFESAVESQILNVIIINSENHLARVPGWICQISFSWKNSVYVKVVNRIVINKRNTCTHCSLKSLKIFSSSVCMFLRTCHHLSFIQHINHPWVRYGYSSLFLFQLLTPKRYFIES